MSSLPLALRIKEVERANSSQKTKVPAWDSSHFLITPSCPPSTTLQMRGGWIRFSPYWLGPGTMHYVPSVACDLTDFTKTEYTGNFTNANWYHGAILCIYLDLAFNVYDDPSEVDQWFQLIGTGVEYETAAEAEGRVDYLLNGNSAIHIERVPLWGIVLRNDGQTGVDAAILPVDAINRGRSYLYRDARARNWIDG